MITRGISTVANGMQAMLDFEDVTAHNLANVTTAGFKKTNITFQDIMQSKVHTQSADGTYKEIGALSVGARTDRTYIDFSQGGLMESGDNLDVAIQGDGFYKVRYRDISDDAKYNEQNYYYQRTGAFKIDDNNYLINHDGDYIMDMDNRRIKISRDPQTEDKREMNRLELKPDLLIDEKGQIQLNSDSYQVMLQKIQICDFKDKTKISGIGHGKYLPIYGQNPEVYTKEDGTFSLQQGMFEMSNAKTIEEMLHTINVSRGYESMSKILKEQSDSIQKSTTVGEIS